MAEIMHQERQKGGQEAHPMVPTNTVEDQGSPLKLILANFNQHLVIILFKCPEEDWRQKSHNKTFRGLKAHLKPVQEETWRLLCRSAHKES